MNVFIAQIVVIMVVVWGAPVSRAIADAGDGYTDDQCVECHEAMAEDHAASVHGGTPCLRCHPQAALEAHEASPPPPVDCRMCHAPHDEKVAGDAHTRVTCRACHQQDGVAVADPESGQVVFGGRTLPGRPLSPHQMVARTGDAQCRACHFNGNHVGASAMPLPPKSILCMPCHAATFSIGDRTTIIALLIFAVGMVGLGTVWFSGNRAGRKGHGRQGGVAPMMVAFVGDVLFIKRLYRLSPERWCIHALIYYPILMRLTFGMIVLSLSLLLPDADLTRALLNKNQPARALFFDLTGLMMMAGVLASLFRSRKDQETLRDLPAPGRGMTLLLGLIVLVGFLLEGLRIAMTGWPAGVAYSPIGHGISLLVGGMTGISDVYGYVWYGHAIGTGAFVALIPFTRMIHMFTAPVVLMSELRSRHRANH